MDIFVFVLHFTGSKEEAMLVRWVGTTSLAFYESWTFIVVIVGAAADIF